MLSPTASWTWRQGAAAALPLLGHWIQRLVTVTCSLGLAVGFEPRIASAKTILLPEKKD